MINGPDVRKILSKDFSLSGQLALLPYKNAKHRHMILSQPSHLRAGVKCRPVPGIRFRISRIRPVNHHIIWLPVTKYKQNLICLFSFQQALPHGPNRQAITVI